MDRPFHKEPSGQVKKRQAALFGRFTQECHDLGHAFLARAPIAALLVHVAGALVALTAGRRNDMERPTGKESLEFGARAMRRRQGIYFVQKRSRQSREKGIAEVNKNPLPFAAYNKLIQL